MRVRTSIRIVAALTAIVAGIWLVNSPALDTLFALCSAIVTFLGTYILPNNPQNNVDTKNTDANMDIGNVQPAVDIFEEQSYAQEVGNRMLMVRTNFLRLSKRDMCEFLEVGQVGLLEEYESGRVEYPLNYLKKVEKFFHINKRYIETGESAANDRFSLYAEDCGTLLDEGYSPYIACHSKPRDMLYAYIIMEKLNRNGHWTDYLRQVIVADPICSFSSSHGGKMNVEQLIRAMLLRNLGPSGVTIFMANSDDWAALENGLYFGGQSAYKHGTFDTECEDIFYNWFSECKDNFDGLSLAEKAYNDSA